MKMTDDNDVIIDDSNDENGNDVIVGDDDDDDDDIFCFFFSCCDRRTVWCWRLGLWPMLVFTVQSDSGGLRVPQLHPHFSNWPQTSTRYGTFALHFSKYKHIFRVINICHVSKR